MSSDKERRKIYEENFKNDFEAMPHVLLKRIARHYNKHIKISYVNKLTRDELIKELNDKLHYKNGSITLKSNPSYKIHIDDLAPKKPAPKPKKEKAPKAPKPPKAKKEKKVKSPFIDEEMPEPVPVNPQEGKKRVRKGKKPASKEEVKEEVKKEVLQIIFDDATLMNELQEQGVSMDEVADVISNECDELMAVECVGTPEERKKQYREQARKLHPDKNPKCKNKANEEYVKLQNMKSCTDFDDYTIEPKTFFDEPEAPEAPKATKKLSDLSLDQLLNAFMLLQECSKMSAGYQTKFNKQRKDEQELERRKLLAELGVENSPTAVNKLKAEVKSDITKEMQRPDLQLSDWIASYSNTDQEFKCFEKSFKPLHRYLLKLVEFEEYKRNEKANAKAVKETAKKLKGKK